MNYFLETLNKYFVFEGRARRKEYWFFVLFYYILYFLFVFGDALLGLHIGETEFGFLTASYILLMFIPGISVAVRRLHDTGKSGFMIFINFVPLIGIFWFLFLMIKEGDYGRNQFGDNPKQSIFDS